MNGSALALRIALAALLVACANAPKIQAISPHTGATTGGTQVLINGTGLSVTDKISFGGTPAAMTSFLSASAIFAVTPAHDPGVVDVELTTADGFTTSLTSVFTFLAPGPGLTLTSIAPTVGPAAGGTTVMIVGNGFITGVTVTIGGIGATDVMVQSPTSLTATTPPHAPGAVPVIVDDTSGNSATLSNAFAYQ